jgi:hypothetical protein
MRKVAIVALFVAGIVADFTPNWPYKADMPCQQCIRGGYDFCVTGTFGGEHPIGTTSTCYDKPQTPEVQIPESGKGNGYICSNGMDKTNAIVAGCLPKNAQDQQGNICGPYFIDLSLSQSLDSRFIQSFPVGNSCSYRVFSTCGYPTVYMKVLNPQITKDYDVFYSYQTGMQRDEDFDSLYNYKLNTDSPSSFQSGTDASLDFISEGYTANQIPKVDFDACNSKNRNLYITITRIQNSTKPALEEESFLSENARQLQTKFHDLELGFVSIQGGNAKLLGALSFAMLALLSVFAF